MKPIWLNVSNNFLPDWLLLLCTAPFTKLKTFRCTKAGLMFKAFCLATKNPYCQNGWPTFDTTHASNKKEKAVKLLVMILNLVWKMSCKTAVSRRPPRLAFFCADKSLIQHTHRDSTLHKEYEKWCFPKSGKRKPTQSLSHFMSGWDCRRQTQF